MRLIHTKTFHLKEFTGYDIPQYSILSHTWGKDEDEVTYKDVSVDPKTSNGGNDELGIIGTLQRPGAVKIRGCCNIASDDGFQWLWVDTCCIDKSSSAELTEAINSMYAYYQKSARCYVYLADVSPTDYGTWAIFRSSRWFTRGWTLQELLAPNNITFYSNTWSELGRKSGAEKISSEFMDLLSDITGIDEYILRGTRRLQSISIARRMSWAARRETKRVEDRAYSLLGIFNVNMPMMYGEGVKAFLRLQEEIMKDSEDHSLFAWRTKCDPDLDRGLLAGSPDDFADSGRIFQFEDSSMDSRPYSKTNSGLSISLELAPCTSGESYLYVAKLQCAELREQGFYTGVYLKRKWLGPSNQFTRVYSNVLPNFQSDAVGRSLHHLYVRQPTYTAAQDNIVFRYRPSQTPNHKLTRVKRVYHEAPISIIVSYLQIASEVQFNFDFPAETYKIAAILEFTSKIDYTRRIDVVIGSYNRSEIGWYVTTTERETERWLKSEYFTSSPRRAGKCVDFSNLHDFADSSGHVQDGHRILLGVHQNTSEKVLVTKPETERGARDSVVHLEIRSLQAEQHQEAMR